MNPERALAGVFLVALLPTACGGSGRSVTQPSVVATSIVVDAPVDFMAMGQRVTFAATAVHSDGSSAAVTDWSSDNPAVATIDAATRAVTAVGPGEALISARHDGIVAPKKLRVTPDYAGTWSGQYRLTGCTQTGGFQEGDWCGTLRRNVDRPVSFDFVLDRDTVRGTMACGDFTGSVTGAIALSGALTLTGTAASGTVSLTHESWNANVNSDGKHLAGTFQLRATDRQVSGSALLGYFMSVSKQNQ
jgi:hypothetical protein